MTLPELSFPLEVDFAQSCYWIGDAGPYRYGEAVTALFTLELIPDDEDCGFSLTRELSQYLQAFGGNLVPFAPDLIPPVSADVLLDPMSAAARCSICMTLRAVDAEEPSVLVERYTFQSLRDFLYIELIRAIRMGNAPRQCRHCKRWFFHAQGEKALYCDRPVSAEDKRTCRMVGASEVFEKKARVEKPWEYYKRAYKKYYARMMKGNMTEAQFAAWRTEGERLRDDALAAYKAAEGADTKARILADLKQALNEQ